MKKQDKYAYKSVIAERKSESKTVISNDLHDSLLHKRSKEFWKTWKQKVCDNRSSLPCIDGSFDDNSTSDKFKDYFQRVCVANSTEYDHCMKQQFASRLTQVLSATTGSCIYNSYAERMSVELVGLSIAKLHAGKAQGHDSLQLEH